MPKPAWVERKIRNLISSSSGKISYSEAASEIGTRGANKRHHKHGRLNYRSPAMRPASAEPTVSQKTEVEIGKQQQLSLGLQLHQRYY